MRGEGEGRAIERIRANAEYFVTTLACNSFVVTSECRRACGWAGVLLELERDLSVAFCAGDSKCTAGCGRLPLGHTR